MTLTNGLEMATAKQHLMALDAYLKTRQGHESALIKEMAKVEREDIQPFIDGLIQRCIHAEKQKATATN